MARRPGCGTSCVPPVVQPPWLHRGHCTQSCQSQGTASSSNARCGTDGPHHRCVSTHSSCWSPTCLGSEDSPQWLQITQAKPDWKEVRPTSVDCAHVNPVLDSTTWNVGCISCKCSQLSRTWLPSPMLTPRPSFFASSVPCFMSFTFATLYVHTPVSQSSRPCLPC